MNDINIGDIRRHCDIYYKVKSLGKDKVICNSRNGPIGRYSKSETPIPISIFKTYSSVKSASSSVEEPKTEDVIEWSDDISCAYENKVLQDENRKLKNEIMKRRSGEDIIIRAVTNALTERPISIKMPPMPPKDSESEDEEIAILHISDVHIGKITDSYSTAVADQRMVELMRKACRITDVRRNGANINEIRVYLGGDIIEGENIFPHQAHLIDQSVYDQAVLSAPVILIKCLLMLLEHFQKVKVLCVSGNHGRNGPKKGNRSHPRTNWDNISYITTKRIIRGLDGRDIAEEEEISYSGVSDIDNKLEFHISDKFYVTDRVFDWGNLVVHGHQITGGFAGFPWYGTAKKAWGWIDAIPEPWDYLWFGHFHTFASATLNYRMFLANGSTESDNDFAQANLASAGYPCQRMCFCNNKNGLIADHQIFLGNGRIPSKIRALGW